MSEQLESTEYIRALHRGMLNSFNQEELKVIAFYLSVSWDDLAGESRVTKTQALIMHFAQRGQLDRLVALLREERPDADWPQLPDSEQQIKDELILNLKQEDWVGGDKITTGNLSDVKGTALGRESQAASIEGNVDGTFIQAQGDVTLGKKQRDEQYEIVMNWESRGRPRMREFDLSGRDLTKLILADADLQNANLRRANLDFTDLQSSDLSKACLDEAFLHKANLQNADLGSAKLYKADLSWADLSGANLSFAILSKTDLRGCNLSRAEIFATGFDGARYSTYTKWPDGFDPKAAGAILVDATGNPVEDAES